jgi:hypothetical protein
MPLVDDAEARTKGVRVEEGEEILSRGRLTYTLEEEQGNFQELILSFEKSRKLLIRTLASTLGRGYVFGVVWVARTTPTTPSPSCATKSGGEGLHKLCPSHSNNGMHA